MPAQPPDANPSDLDIAHGLTASRQLQDPPDAVVQRAMAVWRPRATALPASLLQRVAAGLVQRVQAVLSQDSGWAPAPAFGLRSSGDQTRQMLFSAQGHDIDLRISPAPEAEPGHWRISGQLLGPAATGRALLFLAGWSAEAAWDELCEFRFDAVPSGRCTLLLMAADWQLELGPIDLPETP